jgi:hypothetical protein
LLVLTLTPPVLDEAPLMVPPGGTQYVTDAFTLDSVTVPIEPDVRY